VAFLPIVPNVQQWQKGDSLLNFQFYVALEGACRRPLRTRAEAIDLRQRFC